MEKLSLRQKSIAEMVKRIHPIKRTIRDWYYHAGMKFLEGRELTDEQEAFLEEVTDFFMDNLENIEHDKSFLKRVPLDPIQLPQKKKSDKKNSTPVG